MMFLELTRRHDDGKIWINMTLASLIQFDQELKCTEIVFGPQDRRVFVLESPDQISKAAVKEWERIYYGESGNR